LIESTADFAAAEVEEVASNKETSNNQIPAGFGRIGGLREHGACWLVDPIAAPEHCSPNSRFSKV